MGNDPDILVDQLAVLDPARRAEALHRVTDLYLAQADRFTKTHVALFDDVISTLAYAIETEARRILAGRLASIVNPPPKVIAGLALDTDIDTAWPVIVRSPALPDAVLVQVAAERGQAHQLALCDRATLPMAVTDVLVQRGDETVARRIVHHPGAKFSPRGFERLAERAIGDEVIAAALGARADVPAPFLRMIMDRANARARQRLLDSATERDRAQVIEAATQASETAAEAAGTAVAIETLHAAMLRRHAVRPINERHVAALASAGRHDETIAALAVVSNIPVAMVERLMRNDKPDPVLLLARAMDFGWPTAAAILRARRINVSPRAIEEASDAFQRLSRETARRVVRFWESRGLMTEPMKVSA